MKNHYLTILNLDPGATKRDIKQAYCRLAKQCHPDCSSQPDAKEQFVRITEAYRFLPKWGPLHTKNLFVTIMILQI